jgi:hypothetical protein
MAIHLTLTALPHFSCIGSDCPDDCCTNWRIPVDAGTWQRWQAMSDPTLRSRLLENVATEVSNGATVRFLAMQEDNHNHCPHLSTTGLCEIQQLLGADAIPQTCQIYPRQHWSNNLAEVKTLSLSCPEAARMALFSPASAASFERTETRDTTPASAEKKFTLEFGLHAEAVLIVKKYPVNVRLFYLAWLLGRIRELSLMGQFGPAEFRALIKDYRNRLYDINLSAKHVKLTAHPVTAGSMWHSVYGLMRSLTGLTGPKLAGLDDSALAAPMNFPHVQGTADQFVHVYETVNRYRLAARSKLTDEFRPFLDRYLEISLQNHGFPWNPLGGNHIATFLCSTMPYVIVQLLSWHLIRDRDTFSAEDLHWLIYKTERSLGHNNSMILRLAETPHMLQIERYASFFLEIA